MATRAFRMQQFTVEQQHASMKVCTDACLFGAYVPTEGCTPILDVGTGTGLLALMLAQRTPLARITALEIEAGALTDAAQNFSTSPFAARLELVAADARAYRPSEHFDRIIANPPFFTGSTPSQDSGRNLARHVQDFTFADLCQLAVRALAPHGQLWVLMPEEALEDWCKTAAEQGLFIVHTLRIKPYALRKANRYVVGLQLTAHTRHDDELIIYETEGVYTRAAEQLSQPFYLRFADR